MVMFAVPQFDGRASCAEPSLLPVVDEAFRRPGGDIAHQMRRLLCGPCPIATQCLAWAMAHREHGVWGGTSPKVRTQHGASRQAV